MSNKKFGYARVSTAEQNEDRQVLELLEYGIEERDIYVRKVSRHMGGLRYARERARQARSLRRGHRGL